MSSDDSRLRVRRIETEEFVDLLVSRRRLARVRSPGPRTPDVPRLGLVDLATGEIFVPVNDPRSVCEPGGGRVRNN